jgi:hypothetical protein
MGFASIFDLLNRLGSTGNQLVFGRRILDRILDPWISQKEPVPVVSKWKRVRQPFRSISRDDDLTLLIDISTPNHIDFIQAAICGDGSV